MRNDRSGALAALDSALARFPAHQWCLDMRGRIEREIHALSQVAPRAAAPATSKPLSEELQREIETLDRRARDAFERGELQDAILNWERVLGLSPAHGSVKAYLVNAYKYVGVDLYGQNRLREAVETWRKAARIEPHNEEIRQYISRTENEIMRLQELSYDQ